MFRLFLPVLLAVWAIPASAGLFDEMVKKVERRGANEATDAAYDGAKSTAKDAVSGKKDEQPKQAAPARQPAAPAPAAAAKSDDAPVPAPARPATSPATPAPTTPAPDTITAGELYDNKFDFVPGENVIVFDDFVETDVGDLPARWSIKGYGAGGAPMSVIERQGKKWYSAEPAGQQYGGSYLRLAKDGGPSASGMGGLPDKTTIEFDIAWGGAYEIVLWNQKQTCTIYIRPNKMASNNSSTPLAPRTNAIEHVSIMVNRNYVKAYLGGVRAINDNECLGGRIDSVRFMFGRFSESAPGAVHLMTNFRLAEGGKDFVTSLAADGRIITHGITFDTGSDVLKPESGPTLRKILKLLQDDSALRFEVQGHTDNQGGDKVNGPLSEKRAIAVKAWLVKQGIENVRLTTKGLGSTKPLSSNETAEGCANNRRVEFVKLTGTS